MKRQLFIYYRIPKADIAVGLQSAKQMAALVQEKGLGHSQLYQREEVDKPYFTLMEVIHPAPEHSACLTEFTERVEQLATICFAGLPTIPNRHIELFSSVDKEVNE